MQFLNFYRSNQRREAKLNLRRLDDAKGKYLVIHYSCESFYGKDGITPRVTGIGVLNKENNESRMFSIHLSAQILKLDISNVPAKELDDVEKHMHDEFSKYVENHLSYIWLHWNMRSASYGFQAISNRYRILGGKEINIPDTNKLDLRESFGRLFTYSFEADAPHGQLLNLAKRNRVSIRDALAGADEAQAFEDHDYLKLHLSTMRKVDVIDQLLTAYRSGKLKQKANIIEIYDLSIPGVATLVRDSPILFAIWSIIIFIIGAAMEPVIQGVFGTAK